MGVNKNVATWKEGDLVTFVGKKPGSTPRCGVVFKQQNGELDVLWGGYQDNWELAKELYETYQKASPEFKRYILLRLQYLWVDLDRVRNHSAEERLNEVLWE